ncbi:MAG: sulfatase-like hydrolase/transferase [Candidatus Latescibacteria bacterium]|nr:sulfatase-like hydrolase/transferase [Candidatus Latescibacterota bacterium]
MPDRPNFLIICTDQHRADHLGCDGNSAIKTPNIDQLASQGVQFDRGYVNCPLCMPSRATMFTGMTPRGHGVRTNGIPLDERVPTVPGALSDAGYTTASIGKIHLSNMGVRDDATVSGFDPYDFPEIGSLWQSGEVDHIPTPYYGLNHVDITLGHGSGIQGHYAKWLEKEHSAQFETIITHGVAPPPLGAEACGTYQIAEEYHHTTYVADRTVDYLENYRSDDPYFLMCSFPDPHHPYYPPEPWDRMYGIDDVIPPAAREGELEDLAPFFTEVYNDCPRLSGRIRPTKMPDDHRLEILAHVYGMISLIDKQVGRLLTALEESGKADNTVVVFTADHGDMMGDHGLHNKGPFHFEGLLRVPMIWSWPGRFESGATLALASLLDFAPTVMDLAGVPIPEGPGSSEAMPSQPPPWPGRSLTPVLNGDDDHVQESVVVENDEDYLGLRLRTLITATHKITTYTGHRGAEPFGELFDLERDPQELYNLWDRQECAGLRRELIEKLHHRLTETDIAVPRRLGHA